MFDQYLLSGYIRFRHPNNVDNRSINTTSCSHSFNRVVPSYSTLYFDAKGTAIQAILWLKNENDNPKRILLYSLVIVHPCGNVPLIVLVGYITSKHNTSLIRKPFLGLKELEQKSYGSISNISPNFIVTDYSTAMIQSVIQEMIGYTLQSYLQKTYDLTQGGNEDNITNTTLHIC